MPAIPVDPTAAEQLAIVIGALASLIIAIGGWAKFSSSKEIKNVEGPSAPAVLKAAVDRNTDTQEEQIRILCDIRELNKLYLEEMRQMGRDVHAILGVARSAEHMLIEIKVSRK